MGKMKKRVHIVISDRDWILERLSTEITSRLSGISCDTQPDSRARLNYYMTYGCRGARVSELEAALFTHIEEDANARERFRRTAQEVDLAIAMSNATTRILAEIGNTKRTLTISPGVNLERFAPRLRIGIVGRTYHTGRKGEALVNSVMDVPDIDWVFTGDGWPNKGEHVPEDDLPAFYRSLDYVLVPALNEGGPMCVLEALASGVPVIGSNVGWIPDFPHIPFDHGSQESLRAVLLRLREEKFALRRSVEETTWERWATEHGRAFEELLSKRAIQTAPAINKVLPRRVRSAALIMAGLESSVIGGPSVRVPRTAQFMQQRGVRAVPVRYPSADLTSYDLGHAYNIWPPITSVRIARRLAVLGKPFVFSPILLDLSEGSVWQHDIVVAARGARNADELEATWRRIRQSTVPATKGEPEPGYIAALHEIAELADAIIFLSEHERQLFRRLCSIEPPLSKIIWNPVDADLFSSGDSKLFYETYGVKDYVLCVARVEHRKNQLLLALALRDTGIPLVLVGHAGDEEYASFVRKFGGANLTFIDRLAPGSDMLRSAIAGARVVTLPSWAEGAPLAALEAGAAGARLVLSDRSSEREYFGNLARYCNPSDPASIRATILEAWNDTSTRGCPDKVIADFVRQTYSWPAHIESTLTLYEEVGANRAQGLIPSGAAKFKKSNNINFATAASEKPVRIIFDLTTMANNASLRSGIVRVEASLARTLAKTPGVQIRYIFWRDPMVGFIEVPSSVAERQLVYDFVRNEAGAPLSLDGEWKGARLIIVGSSWMQNDAYVRSAVGFAAQTQTELCVLMHDLTPYLFPQWFPDGYSERFTRNMATIFSAADRLLIYSDNTRADVERAAIELDIDIGQFGKFRLADDIGTFVGVLSKEAEELKNRLHHKPYVLATGAIHARKNYELLYDVWTILRRELGDACPHLVIAGGVSWNGQAIARTMEVDKRVSTHIHILTNVDDSALDWLYRNCLLTAYPSLYEGWGLPVGESLSYGKICIASNRSSIPEIAPALTDLIDPLDRLGWAARIRHYASSATARRTREKFILDKYSPTTWSDSAIGLRNALTFPPAPPVRNFYTLGEVVSFSSSSSPNPYLLDGWASSEPWGTWTLSNAPRLRFRIHSVSNEDLIFTLLGRTFGPPGVHINYFVQVNGKHVGRWKFHNVSGPNVNPYVLSVATIPRNIVGTDGIVEIQFIGDRTFRVKELNPASEDPRSLGLGVAALCFQTPSIAQKNLSELYAHRPWIRTLQIGSLLVSPLRIAFPFNCYLHPWSPHAKTLVATPNMISPTTFVPASGIVKFVGGLAGIDLRFPTLCLTLLVVPTLQEFAPTRFTVFINGEYIDDISYTGETAEELSLTFPTVLLTKRDPAEIFIQLKSATSDTAHNQLSKLAGVRIGTVERPTSSIPIEAGLPIRASDFVSQAQPPGAWYASEQGSVWSVGNLGTISLTVDLIDGGGEFLKVELSVLTSGSDRLGPILNGIALPKIEFIETDVAAEQICTLIVPLAGLLQPSTHSIILELPRGPRTVPAMLGVSADERELGIRLSRITMVRSGLTPDATKFSAVKTEMDRAAFLTEFYTCVNERRQLFVDVSRISQNDLRTGIQRVTRSIFEALKDTTRTEVCVVPVRLIEGRYRVAARFVDEAQRFGLIDGDIVAPNRGDVFFGLDLVHEIADEACSALEVFRANGVPIYFLVYDLLPIFYPEFFPNGLPEQHFAWLQKISQADGLFVLSNEVEADLRAWLDTNAAPASTLPIYRIPVGDALPAFAVQVENALANWIEGAPTVVCVGTVEPRKQLDKVLAAFEVLWQRGENVHWLIIGRSGWKTEKLQQRLVSHSEYNRRLRWIDNAGDEVLSTLLSKVQLLLAASVAEGAALPLIEAAYAGLPVVARDIPPYREALGDAAYYFSSVDPSDLADLITTALAEGRGSSLKISTLKSLPTWNQAAQLFALTLLGPLPSSEATRTETTRTWWAISPKFNTVVGRREGRWIHSTSQDGFLLFGPYVPLEAGSYQIEVYGRTTGCGVVILDVASNCGGHVHATEQIANVAGEASIFGYRLGELNLQLHAPVIDLEIRIHCNAEAVLSIAAIRITPLTSEPIKAEYESAGD